jgi:hypothetical protein
VAGNQDSGEKKVDPRTESAGVSRQLLASKDFGGIAESQEAARQWAQKFLFWLIAGCLTFLALFDSALLLPAVHLEMKVIATVSGAFAGGSGLLGVCASYILAPYKKPRARSVSGRR